MTIYMYISGNLQIIWWFPETATWSNYKKKMVLRDNYTRKFVLFRQWPEAQHSASYVVRCFMLEYNIQPDYMSWFL